MLQDRVRVSAYRRAIHETVHQGDVVSKTLGCFRLEDEAAMQWVWTTVRDRVEASQRLSDFVIG
jgi:hypothetical protein